MIMFYQREEMRHRISLLFLLGLFALFQTLNAQSKDSRSDSISLVFLHVNDTHGHFEPFDMGDKKNVGGIARMATLIKSIREENEERTLLFHAGDIFSRGDPLTVYYAGKLNMLVMDTIGYDVLTPGNGEFYTGIHNLLELTALVQFPTVLANVVYKNNGERLFPAYVIKDIAGVKIGILGLGHTWKEHPSAWSLETEDPVSTARQFLPYLRKNTDIVIALTHLGLEQDMRLAKELPELDIIIGGHSHHFLDTPKRVPKPDGKEGIVITQAGTFGLALGRLDVHLKKDSAGKYQIQKINGKLLHVDQNVKEDRDIHSLIKRYSEPLSEVICTSKVRLENPSEGPNPMGNLMVRAIHTILDADAALLFRPAIHDGILPGNVTLERICRIHKWRSRIFDLTITGDQLQDILAQQNVMTSGISYQKTENDVSILKIGSREFDRNKFYTVLTDEALLAAIPFARNIPLRETSERVDTALIKYLRQLKVIEGVFEEPALGYALQTSSISVIF